MAAKKTKGETMLQVGSKVLVYKNTVFKYYGFREVTGTITEVGRGSIIIYCNETSDHETVDLSDGKVKVIE